MGQKGVPEGPKRPGGRGEMAGRRALFAGLRFESKTERLAPAVAEIRPTGAPGQYCCIVADTTEKRGAQGTSVVAGRLKFCTDFSGQSDAQDCTDTGAPREPRSDGQAADR